MAMAMAMAMAESKGRVARAASHSGADLGSRGSRHQRNLSFTKVALEQLVEKLAEGRGVLS